MMMECRCDNDIFYIRRAHLYTHLHTKMVSLFSSITRQHSKHFTALITGCVFVFFANQVFQLIWLARSALENYFYCWYNAKPRLESLGWSLWTVYRHKSSVFVLPSSSLRDMQTTSLQIFLSISTSASKNESNNSSGASPATNTRTTSCTSSHYESVNQVSKQDAPYSVNGNWC